MFKEWTEDLDFIINQHGVTLDSKKIETTRLYAPTTVQEVFGLIGLCSYYRRFLPNFFKIQNH